VTTNHVVVVVVVVVDLHTHARAHTFAHVRARTMMPMTMNASLALAARVAPPTSAGRRKARAHGQRASAMMTTHTMTLCSSTGAPGAARRGDATTTTTRVNKGAPRSARFMDASGRDGRRGATVVTAASASVAPMEQFKKFSELFANLFPIWTILAAVVGVMRPATFEFMTSNMYTGCLALLMFSMGITLTIDDFKRVFAKPGVISLGFLACYVMMPALAFVIGNALGLSGPLLAGLILVGSINGGQASNLCAYIARGDVALSVLMTTATTVGCIFMTPLICKLALGAVVDVDAIGMAVSTIQVVLVPVVVGLFLNKNVPKVCRSIEPFSPVIGVTMTIILVGGAVANCAAGILGAGMALQAAAFALHFIGGVAGYWIMRVFKYSETTCRTVAIETAMKSSAFGFLLASLHFPEYLVRVPSAVSVVWMAVLGSTMAVVWRFIPVEDK